MNKLTQKAVALLTVCVMIFSLLPVISLPAFAAVEKEFDGKMELDYDALFEEAYIVWPTGSTSAKSWTFSFRGESKTVTYDNTRCYKSFSTAYSAFIRKGASTVATQTPVFVLIGNVTVSTTIYGNIIILGANAGISPNANTDIAALQATDPNATWAAGSRYTETVLTGSFTHNNNSTYDAAAKTAGVKEYNIIIDGVQLKNDSTVTLVNNKYTANTNATPKKLNYYVKNTIMDFNKNSIYAFTGSGDSVNTHNYSLENVRMPAGMGSNTYSVHKGLFDEYAANIVIDGLFYENNQCNIYYTFTNTPDQIDVKPHDFSFTMKNSMVRGNGTTSPSTRALRFGLAKGKNEINLIGNTFYKTGYVWGFISFKSGSDIKTTSTEVNIKHNLIFDVPSTPYSTLVEGNTHLAGPYSYNLTYNRIIGYSSVFPTMAESPFNSVAGSVRGTTAYNYTATKFSNVNDTAGTIPAYYSTSYPDHYKFSSLLYKSSTDQTKYESALYYTDYKMTETSDKFDVTEADFYDDLDYITVNNEARIIRLRVAKGVTISGLSKNYGFKFVGKPSSVSFSNTSISSSASTTTMTVTINGSSVTYTIYAEGHTNAVSYKNIAANDKSGTLEASRVYLYSPSGATTATFNGVTYDFSGRSYKTIAEILSTASILTTPQIIIPAGTYDAITLTKRCELYGECWDSPATGGTDADVRVPGDRWIGAKETVIKGITLSSGVSSSYLTNSVTISGIVLTGALTDTARSYPINLTFKNSAVNGGTINLENSATKTKTSGSFTMSGVKVVDTPQNLFTGNIPYNTTLTNVEYAPGSSERIVSGWNSSLSSSACSLTIQNCYFNEIENHSLTDITAFGTFSNSTVNLKNNTFIKTFSDRSYYSLLGIDAAKLKSVTLDGNWFVNKGSAYHTLFDDSNATITFNNNRLIGFDLGGVSADKSNNYYAPYTVDFATVSNGRAYGSTYYIDPDLNATNTAVKIASVSGGEAYISENLKTVYVKSEGNVSLTFSHGGSYTVWEDKDCTVPATLTANGTYYVKTEYKDYSYIYNVRIDSSDSADFHEAYSNLEIGSNLIYVTTLVTPEDYGKRVYFDIDGQEYAFVAGITAFANVRDAVEYAKEKGNTDPRIILGEYSGSLSIPAKAKIYGRNYNNVPYLKTEADDLDWTYNENYNTNKTTVTNIQIGAEATGLVEIYGVEMTGYYLDVARSASSALNVKLENLLVNSAANNNTVLFDLRRVDANNTSNTESFLVKNAYVQSTTSARLLYEFYPANITFDGLYLDCANFAMQTINYIKSVGDNTTLTFKNSNLRNYAPTHEYAFLFQGDDTPVTSGESKKLVFENNVFYNFSFGSKAILPIQPAKLTNLVFKNNKVISQNNTYNLIYSQTNTSNTPALCLDITDNLLLGVNPESNIGSLSSLDAGSVIARNHTVKTYSTKASGSPIKIIGSTTVTESVYALDDTMAPLYKTDFVCANVYSPDNAIFAKDIQPDSIRLSVLDGYSAADFNWNFANDSIVPTFYSDAACTKAVSADKVTKGATYYMTATYTADDGKVFKGDVYSVTFEDKTTDYPLFDSEVIATDAILIDSQVDTSKTYYNAEWDGVTFSFIVGENVFPTLDAAIAQAGAGKSYLIKDFGGLKGDSEYNTWVVTTPGKYYTQNYNDTPFIASDKAADPDGSEWTSNIGEGKFDTAKGIKVKWLVLNAAAAGDYEFHGFTITNCIQDDDTQREARSSDNDINVLFNNTYINKTYSDSPLFEVGTHFMLDASGNKLGDTATEFNDSMTLKNTYFVNSSSKDIVSPNKSEDSDIKHNVNLWTNVTIDGMFADYQNATAVSSTMYIGSYGKEYSFTVKNSNFRNHKANWYFEGHNGFGVDYGTTAAHTRSLIFTDNIFYNFTFYDTKDFLKFKNSYYNELIFDGNYIYAPADNMNLGSNNGGNEVHPDTYVTITNNSLLGFNPYYNFGRWVTWEYTSVKDNYCVAVRPADTSKVSLGGVQYVLRVSNWKYDIDGTTKVYYETNGDFWLDSARSIRTYEIAPMTVMGKDFNTNGQVETVVIPYSATVINLNDYFINPCNRVTFTVNGVEISDITAISAKTDFDIELAVQSYDGTSEIQTRTIKVAHELKPEIAAVSATLHNGISLNFKATGLEGGETMTITFAGNTYTLNADRKEDVYTVFVLENIAPHQMTDLINAKLMSGDQLLDNYSLTLRDYLDGLMYTPGTTDELYNLCVAVLNYGTAAQYFKDYKADDPADMFLSEAEKVVSTPYITNSFDASYKTISAPKTTWAAHSLILDDAVVIKLGFKANTPISKYSVKVEGPAGYSKTFTDCFWYENGKYYFTFDEFSIIDCDSTFYFTIMNGNTPVSNTLSYSADCYISTALESTDANLTALTNALANYMVKAQDYYYSL